MRRAILRRPRYVLRVLEFKRQQRDCECLSSVPVVALLDAFFRISDLLEL